MAPPRRNWLQRMVMLEPGETRVFLLSAAYFFFVLFSYYLLRPVRDTMGIRGDIDKLPWLWTGTTVATLIVSPIFAIFVSRFPRRIFMPWLYRFFALNLLGFWALLTFIPAGPKNVNAGYVFFIWLSVFNLLSTSVFWGFMADAFTQSQSKRLFGAIGVGGTLGAILGGLIPATLAHIVGSVNLMLLSAVGLEVVAQCTIRLCSRFGFGKRSGEPTHTQCASCGLDLAAVPEIDGRRRCPQCGSDESPTAHAPASREPDRNIWEGFVLIARSPYLQMMVVYMLLFTITSTFLYLEQLKIVKEQIADDASRTQLFAWIDVLVNVLTLATQLFLTGRILTRLGVLAGLLLLPVITLAGFGLLWRWETLAVLMGFQIFRRSMHYAVDRPTREVLYTVLGPDAKYKSKSFIDTFVYRSGDLAGAWTTWFCNHVAFAVSLAGMIAASAWICGGIILGLMQRRVAARAAAQKSVHFSGTPAGR